MFSYLRMMFFALMIGFTATHAKAQQQVERMQLVDISELSLGHYVLNDAKAQKISTPTGAAIKLDFGHRQSWPHIMFKTGQAFEQESWVGWEALAITVTNPKSTPVRVGIRIDSRFPGMKKQIHESGPAMVDPGQTVRVSFQLRKPMFEHMRGQPTDRMLDRNGGEWVRWHGYKTVLSHIVAFQLFIERPRTDSQLVISKVELLRIKDPKPVDPFVDQFGQYMHEDWPGKVHQLDDFQKQHLQELQDIQSNPKMADLSKYGGWAKGPKLESTGHFRVTRYQGKWTLVDPQGYLFWSAGIDCVRNYDVTPRSKPTYAFSWLPKAPSPLAKFYDSEEQTIDFVPINLHRKFGENFEQESTDFAITRLESWGFNTLGNWSDPQTWKTQKMPYTIPVYFRVNPVTVWGHHQFSDVFDPQFAVELKKALTGHADKKNDPWLLGVFIHNELPFGGFKADNRARFNLTKAFLKTKIKTHTRQAIIDALTKRYQSIDKLNQSWATNFNSWEQLNSGVALNSKQSNLAKNDLMMLNELIARKYYSQCRDAMRDILPGVMYLGSRFSNTNVEAIKMAGEYCDVVSFNIYENMPDYRDADEWATKFDFPVIIGEFHFGALDRGMFHGGLRAVDTQEERADLFAGYMRKAISSSWCVGAHWFQYRDQPLTGRFNGENFAIGFVSITDTVHPTLRDAARNVLSNMYPLRFGEAK